MSNLQDVIIPAEAYKDDISTPITLFFDYPSSQKDSIICNVVFHNPEDISKVVIRNGQRDRDILQIRSEHELKSYWIPTLKIEKYVENVISGVAELFMIEQLIRFSADLTPLVCRIMLQDTSLLSEFELPNELVALSELNDKKRGTPIEWETPFGPAKVVYKHEFKNLKTKGYIIKPAIEIEINQEQFESTKDLVSNISLYLKELSWLFSFLSKKYVFWCQIELSYRDPHQAAGWTFVTAYGDPRFAKRNSDWYEFRITQHDLLIDMSAFRDVANSMVKRYFEPNINSEVRKLIQLLLSTYTDTFIEHELGLLYSTLEKVIFENTEGEILNNKRFKKIRASLKNYLENPENTDLRKDELDEILTKLLELNRRSYKKRIVQMFENVLKMINIEGDLITHQVLLERIDGVVSRRNKFTHQGKIASYTEILGDIAFIRFLISLWILRLLHYPPDKINKFDSDLMNVSWSIRTVNK